MSEFGYIKAACHSNMVSPVRSTILADLNASIMDGKINLKTNTIPTFRSDIQNTSVKYPPFSNEKENPSANFWENKNYRHVYQAMKQGRQEIAEAITNGNMIYFDT